MSCGEFHSQPKKLDDLTKLTSQKMCFPSSQSAKEIQEIKKRKESKENQDIKLIEEIKQRKEIKKNEVIFDLYLYLDLTKSIWTTSFKS